VLIGTNANLEGYGIDTRDPRASFVSVPMIGLSWDEAVPIANDFDGFLQWLAGDDPLPGPAPKPNPALLGHMLYEIKPVMFGGSPSDPANKRIVSLCEYLQLSAWWNLKVRAARAEKLG
jgi:hypothetical protein